MKIMVTILLGLVIASLQLTVVDAECCTNNGLGVRGFCKRWSSCCGCGPCNIFCCNCDYGCNLEWWRTVDVDSHKGHYKVCTHWTGKREIVGSSGNSSLVAGAYFRTIDSDGDEIITLEEAEVYLKNQTMFKRRLGASLQKKIRSVDINNDGIISPHEFDESL